MDFLLSPELIEFRKSLRGFLAAEVPAPRIRKLVESGGIQSVGEEDEELWTKLMDLGVLAAPVPDALDGLGFGTIAAQSILEEASRVLLPLPLFETVALGIMPLLRLGTPAAQSQILKAAVLGEVKVTGAFHELYSNLSAGKKTKSPRAGVSAKKSASGYTLTGSADFVPSVPCSQFLLIPAQMDSTGDSLGLFSVTLGNSSGMTVTAQPTADLIRNFYRVEFSDLPAELVSAELGLKSLSVLADEISLLAVAELVGVLARVEEMTLDYVKTRVQFGRAIGSFQAIQHKMANVHVASETVAALSHYGAWARDNASEDQFQESARAAKALASESVIQGIEECLQAHGGIAFTYEYDLHLYLRRALVMSMLYGEPKKSYLELGRKLLADKPPA